MVLCRGGNERGTEGRKKRRTWRFSGVNQAGQVIMQLAKSGKQSGEGGRGSGYVRGRGSRRGGRSGALDAVKRLAVACIAVALGRAALLAGRPGSHVGAGERLQLVQLLRQFAQHAGAEVGAALGERPVHAAGAGGGGGGGDGEGGGGRVETTCKRTRLKQNMQGRDKKKKNHSTYSSSLIIVNIIIIIKVIIKVVFIIVTIVTHAASCRRYKQN